MLLTVTLRLPSKSLRIFAKHTLCAALIAIPLVGCSAVARNPNTSTAVVVEKADILNSYPHDTNAFTQGLVIHDGFLYEGTGKNGQSSLRKVSLEDGKVLDSRHLDRMYFGEGITILGDYIYQLTWEENTCFVYDLKSMNYVKHFQYLHAGWGLTNDGTHLIISDGTATLRFYEPEKFQEVKKIQVRDRNKKLSQLNELEWVEGQIWANIWHEDRIAKIDPQSGEVKGWIDLSHLNPNQRLTEESVLNGIAYEPKTKRLFVTGKNWPKVFEISVPSLHNAK